MGTNGYFPHGGMNYAQYQRNDAQYDQGSSHASFNLPQYQLEYDQSLGWPQQELNGVRNDQRMDYPQNQLNSVQYSQNSSASLNYPRYQPGDIQYGQDSSHTTTKPSQHQSPTEPPPRYETPMNHSSYPFPTILPSLPTIPDTKYTPRPDPSNPYLQELVPQRTAPTETRLLAYLTNHLHQPHPSGILHRSNIFRFQNDMPTTLYRKDHEPFSPEVHLNNLSYLSSIQVLHDHPSRVATFRIEINTYRLHDPYTQETRYRLEAKVSCLSARGALLDICCAPIAVEKMLPAGLEKLVEGMSLKDVVEELKRASFVMLDVLGRKRVIYERTRIDLNLRVKERKARRVRDVEWVIVG